MLKKLFNHKVRIAIVLFFVLLLALVRSFEDFLFYDPFLDYFKGNFNVLPLPNYNTLLLILGLLFRYSINSMLSLCIIYVLFKDVNMVKFASILYVLLFILFVISYLFIIHFYGNQNNLLLFYLRRFLIQPVFVMLFIPAFYYQKQYK